MTSSFRSSDVGCVHYGSIACRFNYSFSLPIIPVNQTLYKAAVMTLKSVSRDGKQSHAVEISAKLKRNRPTKMLQSNCIFLYFGCWPTVVLLKTTNLKTKIKKSN